MHRISSIRTSRPAARRLRGAALAAGIFALAAPGLAQADSIVYIDGGNVWSASPDGGHKVQLTDGGNWHSPTQADNGTIAAVQGTGPIQVMANDGRPLHTITTPPAATSNGGTFAPRPVHLAFSPSGKRIAYAYAGLSCPPASTCGGQRSTFYTAADVTEATPHAVWGNQFGVDSPEFVTEDRALVFGGAGSQVSIDDLGGGDYSFTPWMTPNADLGDGEVTRDGRRLATTFDYGENKRIVFYAVSGDVRTQSPPPMPNVVCTSGKDELVADPTWSPDGSSAAFVSKDGIELVRFDRFAPGDCAATDLGKLTTTGSQPDWGPANPPAARWSPPAPPAAPTPVTPTTPVAPAKSGTQKAPVKGPDAGSGSGSAPSPDAPSSTAADPVRFTVAKLTTAGLRRGFTVKVDAAKGARVTVKLTSGARTVGSGSARAKRDGTVSVRVGKLSARKARALRGKTLRLTVTVDGATTAKTVKVG